MAFVPSVADTLRRTLNGQPPGCSCATTVADIARNAIEGGEHLCAIHHATEIATNRERELARIELEAAYLAREDLRAMNEASTPVGDDQSLRAIIGRELGRLETITTNI